MASDPKLVVLLEARLDKFEKQMAQAGLIADRHVNDINGKLEKVGFTSSFLKAAAAAFTLEKAISTVLKTLESAGQTKDVSERVGISAEALQEIQYALRQTGGEASAAAGGMEKFAEQLSKAARGTGELGRLFQANQIKVSDDTMTNLLNLANLIKNARNETDQLAIANMAFGRGAGKAFVGALKEGSAGFIELAQAARTTGNVLRDDVIASGAKLNQQWKDLVEQANKLVQSSIISSMPTIQHWLDKLNEWAQIALPILQAINKFNPAAWAVDAVTDAVGEPGAGLATGPPASGRPSITVNRRPGGTIIPGPRVGGGGDALDAYQRAIAAAQKHTAELEAETAAIDAGAAAQARAKLVVDLTTAAVEANRKAGKANTEVTAEQTAKINEVADAYENAMKKAEAAKGPLLEFGRAAREVNKNLQTAAVQGLTHFEDALVDVITQTKNVQEAFKAMADAILKDLLRVAIRMAITGPLASALGGGLTGGFGSLFPARAAGGAVAAGRGYTVGEHGPETFFPNASGMVVPNAANAGGGGLNLQIINNGANVEAGKPERRADGSLNMVILVDRLTAKNGSTPGSATSRMLRAHGATQPITRRA